MSNEKFKSFPMKSLNIPLGKESLVLFPVLQRHFIQWLVGQVLWSSSQHIDKNQDFPVSDTFLCKKADCVPLHLVCVLKSLALFAEQQPNFNKSSVTSC